MIEAKFAIPKPLSHIGSSLLKDIVFMRRGADGKFLFGFALGWVLRSAQITSEELVIQDHSGLDEGLSVYRVTGEISLLQNDAATINSIKLHQGRLFELHVLYSDGTAESLPYSPQGVIYLDQYALSKYPNLRNYAKEFGVKFKVTETKGGNQREFKLSLTGITMQELSWLPSSDANFYAQFPGLNRALVDTSVIGPSATANLSSTAQS